MKIPFFSKAKVTAKRMFQAAQPNRLTNGWTMLPQPTNYVVRASYRQLVARSREQAENNAYVKRFIDMLVSNVIGHKGILAHPTVKLPNKQFDDVVNSILYDNFMKWGDDCLCDVAGTMTWAEMQRLAVKTLATDGECFIRIYRNSVFAPYGFALQFIDSQYFDVLYEKSLPGGAYIMQGIEFNPFNKPVAYHMYQPQPGDDYATYAPAGNGQYKRIPADEMIHLYIPWRIDQKRGIPMTATALQTLKILDGYLEAGLVAARVGASTMGILTSTGGENLGLADEQARDGSLSFDAEPGVFRQLPNGVTLEPFKPDYPSTAFQPFIKTILRQVASGLGISYTSLSNDIESVNYSSIRQDALQDRELYKVLIDLITSRLIKRVYDGWLQAQLMLGTLNLPTKAGNKTLMLNELERYSPCRFAARAFPSIDPEKDAKSQALQIQQGLRSRSDVIRHDFSAEPDEVWGEIAIENAKMAALGLDFNVPNSTGVVQVKETI